MKFAYADTPYPGMAHFYKDHPDFGGEVDHGELIQRLCDEFPDGWALSTASTTLRHVLALCPEDVRIGSWVKSFGSFKLGVSPAYVWEPVIFRGGRSWKDRGGRDGTTVRDWVMCQITMQRGLVGAKPEAFCRWIFALLGMTPDDEFVDLFPGSGAVTDAWRKWTGEAVYVADGLFGEAS